MLLVNFKTDRKTCIKVFSRAYNIKCTFLGLKLYICCEDFHSRISIGSIGVYINQSGEWYHIVFGSYWIVTSICRSVLISQSVAVLSLIYSTVPVNTDSLSYPAGLGIYPRSALTTYRQLSSPSVRHTVLSKT